MPCSAFRRAAVSATTEGHCSMASSSSEKKSVVVQSPESGPGIIERYGCRRKDLDPDSDSDSDPDSDSPEEEDEEDASSGRKKSVRNATAGTVGSANLGFGLATPKSSVAS